MVLGGGGGGALDLLKCTLFCLKFLYIFNSACMLKRCIVYCISPNVGRYYGLVTGPPPAMEAMEATATLAMEAAMETATERF